ncbi:MAG: glycosyltransferase [Asticcacaulis sp.]
MDVRVLNIMLAKGRGGVETMALRYHEAMRAEGYSVLSLGHPEGVLAQGLTRTSFRPLTSGCNYDIIAAARLYEQVREFKPHLILNHGNRATNLALMPFVAQGAQVVQVLHNQCFKPHLKRVAAAICVSAGVRDGLMTAWPGVRAFEVANFSWLQHRPVKTRPNSPPVIGALGRLHEVKGFDVLLRAAAALRDKGVDFKLRLAGDGPELHSLRSLRDQLGLGGRVEFCGWLSRPEDFMAGLDLFVVPSRHEAFGLVVVEAMAAGVPVVASDIKGPHDILKNGLLGGLCRSEDPLALAEAMGMVFANWPRSLATARQAQAHALSSFGFASGSARLRQAIETIRHNDRDPEPHQRPVFGPVILPAE